MSAACGRSDATNSQTSLQIEFNDEARGGSKQW